jgi:hypothetical protein
MKSAGFLNLYMFIVLVYICFMITSHEVGVPEWLSGMTRNHVGFARAGSNPAAHVLFLLKLFVMTLARDFTPFFFFFFF